MIYIDPFSARIINAFNIHKDTIIKIILSQIAKLPPGDLKTFLNETRVKRIVCDMPNKLESHHDELLNNIAGFSLIEWNNYIHIKKNIKLGNRSAAQTVLFNRYNQLKTTLNNIFKYTGGFAKKTTKYSAYDLAYNLSIQTCTYCNRIYTKTVTNPSKNARPEFDHWFSQESYPILALSFYNLIPSCHVCNSSLKGSIPMTLSEYIHPYLDRDIKYKFSYWIEALNKYEFDIKTTIHSKEQKTVEVFKLKEIYSTHRDEINDLVRLRKLYSIDYLLKLKKLLSEDNNKVSMEELYRLAFGTHFDEENFHKRPLSRMKRDILVELGVIK